MIIPNIDCLIERRLLVNYRIDPERVSPLLPPPFRPELVNGYAVGGMCFIRLSGLRPARLPRIAWLGPTTENVAHRFAVEWDDAQGTHTGVYIPRRDTNSRLTVAAGNRIFRNAHRYARFGVRESTDVIRVSVTSRDGSVSLSATVGPSVSLDSRLFANLEEAKSFFRRGAVGFSPSANRDRLDGVRLNAASWAMSPLAISDLRSSLFDDTAVFPEGSSVLDSALLMTNVAARWSQVSEPIRNGEARAGRPRLA